LPEKPENYEKPLEKSFDATDLPSSKDISLVIQEILLRNTCFFKKLKCIIEDDA
jgi:hypothetical protein